MFVDRQYEPVPARMCLCVSVNFMVIFSLSFLNIYIRP